MKNPLGNLFRKSNNSIPGQIQLSFNTHFPDAVNVEWSQKEAIYEAVFYLNEAECISIFSTNGELIEYKKNVWINDIPDSIKMVCEEKGEIMNIIAIYKVSRIVFEIIVRDTALNRTLFLFSENGKLILSNKI